MEVSPLYVLPGQLRPLAPVMRGIACICCGKRQALWEKTRSIGDQGGKPICSLCFLYESEWTEEQEEGHVVAFVTAVEDHMGKLFPKTEEGILLNCADADRILTSLVMTSRLFHVRSKVS